MTAPTQDLSLDCPLPDRGIVAVRGADAAAFLDNMVTNNLDGMTAGQARFAALLSPQGKILFEFLVVKTDDGYWLDVRRDAAAALVKRLAMYKLRSAVEIVDRSDAIRVNASSDLAWRSTATLLAVRDPRHPTLGVRLYGPAQASGTFDYAAQRVALGVPEGGSDYALGDTFPHEANYDRLHGVSFTKGCYVGQEVVARMQNKTVVRKRVVRVSGDQPLLTSASIMIGEADIGRIGTAHGTSGLATLRIDRACEAEDKGLALMSGGAPIKPDAAALTAYRKSIAEKPVIDL